MAFQVVMPKLSDTMEEGRVLKWLKREGEFVEGGEMLALIETDKADVEMEAFGSGILKVILAEEGARCPVGKLIAVIADPDEDISSLLAAAEKKVAEVHPPEAAPREEERVELPEKPSIEAEELIKASPMARKLAREAGIDLDPIRGTGPGGRITRKDVEVFLEQRKARPPVLERPPVEVRFPAIPSEEYEERELSPMRKAIARRMVQSKAPIPHFYLTLAIDMERAREMREALNRALGPEARVSFTDMVVKAAALALTRHPQLNSSFQEDRVRTHRRIHIGVAVALEEGLVSAVVRDCDRKGLGQIAREVKELAERARARKLRPDELSGSTFTVSNLGMYEVEEFSAVITPPEGSILAVGAILPQPVVKGGEVTAAHKMKVTLSCDHRIIDGAEGARFLQDLKRTLENPILLMG